MADPNVTPKTHSFEDDYAWWEVVYWLVGIIMIPLVPILMIAFFTPFSGVGATGHLAARHRPNAREAPPDASGGASPRLGGGLRALLREHAHPAVLQQAAGVRGHL